MERTLVTALTVTGKEKSTKLDIDEDGGSSGSEPEDSDLAPTTTESTIPTSLSTNRLATCTSGKITMRRVKYLVYLSYLGRGYNGFQKQYNQVGLLTVQDVIEKALGAVGFHRVYMTTGSRTDKGVNAYRHPIVVDVEDPPEVGLGFRVRRSTPATFSRRLSTTNSGKTRYQLLRCSSFMRSSSTSTRSNRNSTSMWFRLDSVMIETMCS